MSSEPNLTPSILATIPDLLKAHLVEVTLNSYVRKRKSTLISSNSLANKFIFTRWGIRPSQRKRYRNLFSQIRGHSRSLFQHLLLRGQITTKQKNEDFLFGVYKFDEVRGNLILGFVIIDDETIFV